MLIDGRSLIVVADAAHARFFEERRQGGHLREQPEWLGDLVPSHKAGAQRGAIHDRMGFALHATGGSDPRRLETEDFLRRLAQRIGQVMRAERIDAFVLFAPPRALGLLREHLDPQVRAKLAHDADVDRIDATPDALRDHLRQLRFPAG